MHRDFKPANVLVADSGRVVVTDFGLATRAEPVAQRVAAGSRPGVGTPAYLAPEQRDGGSAQPSADVYSFAVALCEALAGRHPALAPALDWRLELRRAGLPGRACAAIVRGMAADPAQRWPHLGPLLAALEAALPPPPGRRRRRVAAAGVALGLGVAAAAAFVAATRRPASLAGVIAAGPSDGEAPRSGAHGAHVATARGLVGPNPIAAATLLREVPADQRGEDWSAVARAVLLRPLARELRCLEGRPRSAPSLAHGLLAAVDAGDRAIVCDLAAEQVTSLPGGAVCARVLDADHVGVFTDAGELAIFARGAAWQLRRRIAVGPSSGAPVGVSRCDHDVAIVGPHAFALRDGGAAWQLVDLADLSSTPLVRAAGVHPFAVSVDRRLGLVRAQGLVLAGPVDATAGALAPIAAGKFAAHDPASGVAVAIQGDAGAIIDVRRGAVIRRDRLGIDSFILTLEVAPGGRMAVAATVRGTLVWWPLAGEARAPWREAVSETAVAQIAFNPSGTRLVWRDGLGAIGVRDVDRPGGHELTVDDSSICRVAFAADDRVVATSCDGRVLAWDLREERTFVAGRHDLAPCRPACDAEAKVIWSAGVDPSGSVMATAGHDGTVGIWPLRRDVPGSVARRLSIAPARRAYAVVLAGDRLLVGARDAAAQLWDWRTGARLGELPGHETWVYAFAVAKPASGPATIVTGAKGNLLRFWSDDGRRLLATTAVSAASKARVNDSAVSPSGRRVAAALETGEVAVCDAATGAVIFQQKVHRDWARRVLFRDEETLVSAGDDGVVQQIAVRSGAITSIRAHDRPIYDMDRRGSSLLTASVDGKLRLWDLRDGSLVRTYVGHEQYVVVVRWHPDGTRFVSGSRDGRACVWHVGQDTCHDWLIGHQGEVRVAQFLDETRVATAANDGTVRVWTPVPPGTADRLSVELDRRAPACLDEPQRRSYLGEPAHEAAARARACRSAAR